MKAELIPPPAPKYQPVTLQITFESQPELDRFYHVVNHPAAYAYLGDTGRELSRLIGPKRVENDREELCQAMVEWVRAHRRSSV